MRTIGVITSSRADFGIYRPVLRAIQDAKDLRLHLYVTGMHLSSEYGMTVNEIVSEGFEVFERVEMLLSSDTPESVGKAMGLGTIGFAQAYARHRPDLLLVLGDRFEMFAAALAALPFSIPVAHIHGGELSEGAIDELLRHALTKLSHLHFVATRQYGDRVIQMGEAPWRVTVSGAPSLDNLRDMSLLSREEIESRFGLQLTAPPLLVTYHPVTLASALTKDFMTQLLTALDEVGLPVVFTAPNADTSHHVITDMIEEYCATHANASLVKNLGTQGYFSLMRTALAMVGNSSSGIIEAASFALPVVNIGQRQRGRSHGENVLDAPDESHAIVQAIRQATDPKFRALLAGMANQYGDGHAAERIVTVLQKVSLNETLIMKSFYDLPVGPDLVE